jgi:hypothetical protein
MNQIKEYKYIAEIRMLWGPETQHGYPQNCRNNSEHSIVRSHCVLLRSYQQCLCQISLSGLLYFILNIWIEWIPCMGNELPLPSLWLVHMHLVTVSWRNVDERQTWAVISSDISIRLYIDEGRQEREMAEMNSCSRRLSIIMLFEYRWKVMAYWDPNSTGLGHLREEKDFE